MVKPCPFCGAKQPLNPKFYYVHQAHQAQWSPPEAFYRVECILCQAHGPVASSEEMAELGWDDSQIEAARDECNQLKEAISSLEEQNLALSEELAEYALEPEPEDGSGSVRG